MPPRFKRELSTAVSEKEQARREIRDRLRALSSADRAVASLVICEQAANLPGFIRGATVALFAPLPSEPEIDPLIEEAWAQKKRVLLPFMLHHDLAPELHWHQVTTWAEVIVPGPFGLREPDPLICPRVPALEIDCIFVPGVAFDRDGFRLGRGGGFYDRLLGEFPKLSSTGLMYARQELEQVPREAHDQPLRAVLTEDGLRTF